jgi:hypothetical protein
MTMPVRQGTIPRPRRGGAAFGAMRMQAAASGLPARVQVMDGNYIGSGIFRGVLRRRALHILVIASNRVARMRARWLLAMTGKRIRDLTPDAS